MIHIDQTSVSPSKEWLDKADIITQTLLNATSEQIRNEIISKNEDVWRELKDFLFNVSHGKCWYSESKDKYSHLHIDHFRPKMKALGIDKKDKGGYWWLAFKWKNYRLCGSVGNIRKKDKFPVKTTKALTPYCNIDDEIVYLLDPTDFEDILKITFNSDGAMMPIDNDGWHYEQAKYTIHNLNLNYKILKESRKIIWIKCHNLILEIQSLLDLNRQNPSPYRRGKIAEKMNLLKEMVNKKAEFSATAKTCLESSGIIWAIKCANAA